MTKHTWVIPETKLDPEQRLALKTITNSKKNIWIQGYAGSGKSILLIHAIRHLVNQEYNDAGFVVFTRALVDFFEAGLDDNLSVPVFTLYSFRHNEKKYDLLLADEVQDFAPDDLSNLKEGADRVIVAGDNAQSIYTNRIKPDDIAEELEPQIIPLQIIHRITRTIYNIAKNFGDIIPPKSPLCSDVEVPLWKAENRREEVSFIWKQVKIVAQAGRSVVVLFPEKNMITGFCNSVLSLEGRSEWVPTTNRYGAPDFASLNYHLQSRDIPLQFFGSGAGSVSDPEDGIIRIMTYHSAKGLDFNTVFLPYLDKDTSIYRDESIARSLFFVALTRSRENLHLSYSSGNIAHPFVEEVREQLKEYDITTQDVTPSFDDEDNEDESFIF